MGTEVKAHTTESTLQLTKTQSCFGYPHVCECVFVCVHVHVRGDGVETVPQYTTLHCARAAARYGPKSPGCPQHCGP